MQLSVTGHQLEITASLRSYVEKKLERLARHFEHVIDALLTCGRGQRLGIFAGSGVGKSSLLGMIARSTTAGEAMIFSSS